MRAVLWMCAVVMAAALPLVGTAEGAEGAVAGPEVRAAADESGDGVAASAREGALIEKELEGMKARIAELEEQQRVLTTKASAAALSSAAAALVPAATPIAAVRAAEPVPPDALKPVEPFSDADWTWLNGNPHTKDSPLDSKYFSGEFRADAYYAMDFNHPQDDTISGSSELFRAQELQLEQISIGGDLHVDNVRGRILFLMGEFATGTPRNDASPARGQWDLRNAYRYVAEAYGGYHWDVQHGINVDAGIFVSYIGLFSYYNFDNWAYQPSYVSSNTPWFFEGVRVQYFPTAHLKIEPWFINGWQSYGRFNSKPGLGGQIRWAPKPWMNIVLNNYGLGRDDLGQPNRSRLHTDDSIEVKYYDRPDSYINRAAFTFTGDLGCESGGGVSCLGNKTGVKQSFIGYMFYNRIWMKKDLYAMTIGGGQVNNPGRYLALLPPINGADAISGTPYFTANPGQRFNAWDGTVTMDYMPKQYVTFRSEYGYRGSLDPYFAGRGGVTPPGGNNGQPTQYACATGAASGATDLPTAEKNCGGGMGSVWFPDLRKKEAKATFSIMVKF
ncbi:MAG TPA: outer membrane beta-barrel protein [Acidobacteriaceae bacterium]